MNAELKAWLLELVADVRRRSARTGDKAYDSMVAVYGDLMNTHPNYGYVRRTLALALNKGG